MSMANGSRAFSWVLILVVLLSAIIGRGQDLKEETFEEAFKDTGEELANIAKDVAHEILGSQPGPTPVKALASVPLVSSASPSSVADDAAADVAVQGMLRDSEKEAVAAVNHAFRMKKGRPSAVAPR